MPYCIIVTLLAATVFSMKEGGGGGQIQISASETQLALGVVGYLLFCILQIARTLVCNLNKVLAIHTDKTAFRSS